MRSIAGCPAKREMSSVTALQKSPVTPTMFNSGRVMSFVNSTRAV